MRLKKCRLVNGLGEVYILKFGHEKHNAQFFSFDVLVFFYFLCFLRIKFKDFELWRFGLCEMSYIWNNGFLNCKQKRGKKWGGDFWKTGGGLEFGF